MFKTAQFKGQTLVVILLGTSVALTVALAVSVRTISTLKQTTTSSQAQQALAAAEGGAEVALGHLKDGTCTGIELACNVTGPVALTASPSSPKYTYTTSIAGASADPYLLDLARDQTQEVKLGGSGVTSVKVCWWDVTLDGEETTNALEVIYVDNAGVMSKYAFDGIDSLPSNGFTPTNSGDVVTFPSNGKNITFNRCQTITLTGTPAILRLKALYASFSAVVVIVAPSGVNLPAQGYQIVANGQTADGSVKKAIRVTKSLPSLPGIFDFAVYSGSSTQPLSK